MKLKTIKAWAITDSIDVVLQNYNDGHLYLYSDKIGAKESAKIIGGKVVPCTITLNN